MSIWMMSGAVPPATWVANLSQYVLNSPGCGEIFTPGFAFVYASIIASVFFVRTSLLHQAKARSLPPPLFPLLLLLEPGAQPAKPAVVAAAAKPAPIRNCLRDRAIVFSSS